MPTLTVPVLTAQLDRLESTLPTVPARIVHLQRTVAGVAYDRTATVVQALADAGKNFLDTARLSGKTVTGQTVAAGRNVADTTRTGVNTVVGQAKAQGRKVTETAASETTGLIDSAIDAVDPKPGSGRPYEQWTKAELVERAQELDLEGRSGLNKRQLIAALRKA